MSRRVIVLALAACACLPHTSFAQTPSISHAQRVFYSGDYQGAAAISLALRSVDAENLAAYELRTSALHFQIKRAIGQAANREQAFAQCLGCVALMSEFLADTATGLAIARARIRTNPQDDSARFFLGKLDLNYLWLQLGTLGRRTGWHEYWEARRSLDAVLRRQPGHVRARVARAWMEYIVATELPRGTKWMLGGGNKKRALLVVREAANADADIFAQAEAGFALWEMQVREREITGAVVTARRLASDFPANQELLRFLEAHAPAAAALDSVVR